jgi:hypothetical protein
LLPHVNSLTHVNLLQHKAKSFQLKKSAAKKVFRSPRRPVPRFSPRGTLTAGLRLYNSHSEFLP